MTKLGSSTIIFLIIFGTLSALSFLIASKKITINKDILLEKAGLEKKREENQIDKDSSEKQRSVSPSQIPTISSKPRDNEIAQPSTFQEPSDGSVSPTFTASPTPTSNLVPTTDKPGGKDPDSNQLP